MNLLSNLPLNPQHERRPSIYARLPSVYDLQESEDARYSRNVVYFNAPKLVGGTVIVLHNDDEALLWIVLSVFRAFFPM